MSLQDNRFYAFGPFRLDLQERALLRGGEELPLTPKLFDILLVLVEHQGRTLDKDELLQRVWPDTFVEEGNLARNVSRLRAILGEGPKDERYIKTVARRGYRFVADVGEDAARAEGTPAPPQPRFPTRSRRILLLGGLAMGLLAIGYFASRRGIAPRGRAVRTLAVLPFETLTGDPQDAHVGLSLSDALITRLANVRELVVRPTSAVRRFEEGHPNPVAAGRALAVEAVLEGTVRRVGERVRVTAQLVSVDDGRHLWGGQFDETVSDVFAVEDSITRRLAEALALRLDEGEKQRLAARPTRNPEAYQAYMRGRYLAGKLSQEGFRQAIDYLNRAVALDPDFALAYDGLAYYHINTADLLAPSREAFPRARAMAERALALDDSLAEAHASLANVLWQYEWDWPAAEREFRRALERNPNLALTRGYYAFFLALMGRLDESAAESLRAQDLDPLSPEISIIAGLSHYYAGRHAEAADRFRTIAELEPGSWLAQLCLGRAYEQQGLFAEAVAAYERARRIDGTVAEVLMDLGRGYAAAGRRRDAERVLGELHALADRSYPAPFQIAMVHVGLAEPDRAFAWLEKAYAARSWYLSWLKVEPLLDPLRNDPRYADLLRRMRLAP